MSKRKINVSAFHAFVIVCITIGAVSCHNAGPVIGFMLPHTTIKRYLVEKEAFTKKVEELGGKVIFMSADNDEEKQMEQVKEILKQGIDILVLDPVNRFRAAEMIRLAHNKGIKVISYDRLVANCNIDAFVSFDAAAIGNQMTSYALNKRPTGKYIILNGDKSDINAVLVGEAIDKSLEKSVKSGKIKILYKSFIEKYSIEDTQYELSNYLKLTMEKPDVVITAGDLMAKGVINVLALYGMNGQVLITGQNSELYALKNILTNKQAMTIYKPVKKMAIATAEIAVRLSKGEKIKNLFKASMFNGSIDVPAIFFDVVTVNAANMKNTIISDGFYTDTEVFK